MYFFPKKSDLRVKQILPKGQRPRAAKDEKFLWGRFFFKMTARCCALAGLVYGGKFLWLHFRENANTLLKSVYKQPLERVIFQSDGALTSQWVKPFLGDIRKGIDMMDVDIFALKRRIETCLQVKKVVVQRQFPGTLKMTLEERIPVLRLLVREGESVREMLIDGEGVVFYGESIPELERRTMPFLSGVVLKKISAGRYENIPTLDKVYQLLHIAKTKYWPIYAQMEVVSIEHLKKKSVPWSRINVRCQCAASVIFKDNDFDEQLKRLDFILNTPKIRDSLPVERIDLSLENDAVVKFQK
jgi:cell division septal protein FtsQ